MFNDKLINNLKIDDKYTIVSLNDFSFPVFRNVKIHKAFNEKYAQFDNSLVLHVTDKGKRTKRGVRYTDQEIAIFKGWFDVKECINTKNNFDDFQSISAEEFKSIIDKINNEPVYISMNLH